MFLTRDNVERFRGVFGIDVNWKNPGDALYGTYSVCCLILMVLAFLYGLTAAVIDLTWVALVLILRFAGETPAGWLRRRLGGTDTRPLPLLTSTAARLRNIVRIIAGGCLAAFMVFSIFGSARSWSVWLVLAGLGPFFTIFLVAYFDAREQERLIGSG